MRQAEDLVWNAIVESGKCRFDYVAFRAGLSPAGEERVADYILFQVIAGYAEERSLDALSLRIREDLDLFGFSFSEEELAHFLIGKGAVLHREIDVAKVALAELDKAAPSAELLVQVTQQLAD